MSGEYKFLGLFFDILIVPPGVEIIIPAGELSILG
jgi:hypothetical protein